MPGKPQRRNKFIVKAAAHPTKVMTIPATIQHRKLDQVLMTPMRHRIDPLKFPQLCVKCHQPAGESCLCAQAKANRAFAQQRRAERSIAAQHAKQAAGPSTMDNDIVATSALVLSLACVLVLPTVIPSFEVRTRLPPRGWRVMRHRASGEREGGLQTSVNIFKLPVPYQLST